MRFLIINLLSIYLILEIKGTGHGSGSLNKESTISNQKNELPRIEWFDSLRLWSPHSEDDEFGDDGNYDKRISNPTNDTEFKRFRISGSEQVVPKLKELKGENRNTSGGKRLRFKKNGTVNEESKKKPTEKPKFIKFWTPTVWSGDEQNQSYKEAMSDATGRTKKSNGSAGQKLWFQNSPNLNLWSGDVRTSRYGRSSLEKSNNLGSHRQIDELNKQKEEKGGLRNAGNSLIWSGKLQNVKL